MESLDFINHMNEGFSIGHIMLYTFLCIIHGIIYAFFNQDFNEIKLWSKKLVGKLIDAMYYENYEPARLSSGSSKWFVDLPFLFLYAYFALTLFLYTIITLLLSIEVGLNGDQVRLLAGMALWLILLGATKFYYIQAKRLYIAFRE